MSGSGSSHSVHLIRLSCQYILFRSVNLTESLAPAKYQSIDMKLMAHSIASIVITTISSIRVKALVFSFWFGVFGEEEGEEEEEEED